MFVEESSPPPWPWQDSHGGVRPTVVADLFMLRGASAGMFRYVDQIQQPASVLRIGKAMSLGEHELHPPVWDKLLECLCFVCVFVCLGVFVCVRVRLCILQQ